MGLLPAQVLCSLKAVLSSGRPDAAIVWIKKETSAQEKSSVVPSFLL